MKEKYLHLLWRLKRLPFHTLKLTDGRDFRLHESGVYNEFGSGPDFLNAKVEMDGLIWNGNVEMHVRSSDWYSHGHHRDNAYNNVVLHIVLEDDKPVIQNGNLLPTLEIGHVIDQKHYQNFERLNYRTCGLPCDPFLSLVEPVHVRQMIDRSVINRLERKMCELQKLFEPTQKEQMIYYLLARSFGSKYNSQSFEELATRLPYSVIRRMPHDKAVKLIQQVSGTNNAESFDDWIDHLNVNVRELPSVQSMSYKSWTRGGIRPGAKPGIRVQQFAEIVSRLDLVYLSSLYDPVEIKAHIYEMIHRYNKNQSKKHLRISRALTDQILINCFVPYLYFLSKKEKSVSPESFAELLMFIVPERNSKMDFWKKRGIVPENAWDTQGLLELYNEMCMKKKCLTCSIGISTLSK